MVSVIVNKVINIYFHIAVDPSVLLFGPFPLWLKNRQGLRNIGAHRGNAAFMEKSTLWDLYKTVLVPNLMYLKARSG